MSKLGLTVIEEKQKAQISFMPFTLVVIGEEMENELRQMKIGEFLSWLKEEDRKVYKELREMLSQYNDCDILRYSDQVDKINQIIKENLKLWIQDRYIFPIKNEKTTKFLAVSNTSLLTKVFDIDVENVQNFNADDIVGWIGDISDLYHVIVIGYYFSEEKINKVLMHINGQECKANRKNL